jgi:hypothetical protein
MNMVDLVLLYLGAGLTALWGVAHLVPTKSVVAGFGDISIDNKHIVEMEWITEGVALVFIGALVATVTLVDPLSPVSRAVYLVSAIGLIGLSLVSLFTGFKIRFAPFKLCPFIFSLSAVLILFGGVI